MLQWLLPALLLTVWMKGMNRSKQAYSSSITATPVYDLVELLLSVQCLQISFNCKDILNFRCWEAEQQQQQQWGHRLSFTILSRAGGCRGRWRLLGLSTLCGWSPEHWTRSIQTRVPQFGHIFGKSLYTISQCSNLKCISVFTKRACIRFQIVIAVLWAKVVSFTEYKENLSGDFPILSIIDVKIEELYTDTGDTNGHGTMERNPHFYLFLNYMKLWYFWIN